jgi:hypothetical protein
LALSASRTVRLERREREEPGRHVVAAARQDIRPLELVLRDRFLATAQTSRPKFLAAIPNEPLW